MIHKKICMVGAFAAGKTSLVRQFVTGIYSDRYLTTVGVKIDKRVVTVDEQKMNLVLWDLSGEDEFHSFRPSYLRGSAGYILVADGTRPATLQTAGELRRVAEELLGPVPFVLALNKVDLEEDWRITDDQLRDVAAGGWTMFRTSAKTGEGVEILFSTLAREMLASTARAAP